MFKKGLFAILCITCACITTIQAQLLHNANWVFSKRCGIKFEKDSSLIQYSYNTKNYWYSTSGSFSDINGNLLFYLDVMQNSFQTYTNTPLLKDKNNEIITELQKFAMDGQKIWTIPLGNDEYQIFHFGNKIPYQVCQSQYFSCPYLYYTILKKNDESWTVLEKNVELIDDFVDTKLALIQHANGKDWWVLVHKNGSHLSGTCNNLFYTLLIESGKVKKSFTQNIGSTTCFDSDMFGELAVSNKGDLVVNTKPESGQVEMYAFDRCTGGLSDYKLIEKEIPNKSACFSSDDTKLYTTGTLSSRTQEGNSIIQYDLSNNNKRDTLYFESSIGSQFYFGDIKLMPNGKICITSANNFLAIGDTFIDWPSQYNKNLSIINKPNEAGAACQLEMFLVPLVEGCYSLSALPSFPNYNLGALSIYEANAGADTVYINKEEQEGVQLGSSTVKGITYQWQPTEGLNNITIAQPYAMPNESRLYTVTLTDTTIQHSCKTRVDSVYVVVNNCKEGKYGKDATYEAVKIFPNPARDKITISSSNNCLAIKEVAIIDTRGRTIINTTETTITVSELAESLYMVRIRFTNGQTLTKKLVVYN
jgi:hypothetical protein